MKVLTPKWRKWATVLLGAYLFIAPWILGTSGDEASSANAWIVGACIVAATLRVPIVSGARAAELTKVGMGHGCWHRRSRWASRGPARRETHGSLVPRSSRWPIP
jgi:uncharacterized membrane protein